MPRSRAALPTVDKKVQVNGTGKDATDAKIGDTLTFTLTSTIPDMSAYDTYTFNFKDTLSKGLTYGRQLLPLRSKVWMLRWSRTLITPSPPLLRPLAILFLLSP